MAQVVKLIKIVFGFIYFLYLSSIGKWYIMCDDFQHPSNTLRYKCVDALLKSNLSHVFASSSYVLNNKDRDRVTDFAANQYSDDSLCGYGNPDLVGQSQDRYTNIYAALEIALSADEVRKIVEVGSAIGNNLVYMAKKYSDKEFLGIDFSIKNAVELQPELPNLSFEKGYAVDLMEDGNIKGDVFFSISTATYMTPKELERYIKNAKSCGALYVIFFEPIIFGYQVSVNKCAESFHEFGAIWYHNFSGYLLERGYDVVYEESYDNTLDCPHPRHYWAIVGKLKE